MHRQLELYWRNKRLLAREVYKGWRFMGVIYTLRSWLAMGCSFGAGWWSATPEVASNVGTVMSALFVVAALVVAPPFDFISLMLRENDDED